jgi:hypothetical protein
MKSLKKLLKLSRGQWISVAVLASSLGLAVAVTIPSTPFVAGTPASASEVNANFTTLATAVTTLETKVNALPRTIVALGRTGKGGNPTAIATCPEGYYATGGGVDASNLQIHTSGPTISGSRLLDLPNGRETGLPDGWFGEVVNDAIVSAVFKVAVICSLVGR